MRQQEVRAAGGVNARAGPAALRRRRRDPIGGGRSGGCRSEVGHHPRHGPSVVRISVLVFVRFGQMNPKSTSCSGVCQIRSNGMELFEHVHV